MKYIKSHYDEKTGKWIRTIVEEEGSFGFSTTTDFPIERLKKNKNKEKNKNENEIQENKDENRTQENKE